MAIQFEERDLIRAHPEYTEYRRKVPMILPLRRSRGKIAVEASLSSPADRELMLD